MRAAWSPGGSYTLPEDLFTPEGPRLDLAALASELETTDADLRDACWGGFTPGTPHFGIYGKLGDNKGSFAHSRSHAPAQA